MNIYAKEKLARQHENKSNWREASILWRSIGRKEDANACIMIAEAIEAGDKFRAENRPDCPYCGQPMPEMLKI